MQTAERSKLIRRLALVSLAGQLGWVVIIALAGLIEPGYSAIRDAVSELGADTATRPWLFNIAVAIWGLGFIAASASLVLDGPRGLRGRLGPALIAFTGLCQILDGFAFPADCRTTIDVGCYAREEAGDVSWQHVAHGWTYFFGAIALQLSVFAMAWRFRGDRRWGRADLLAFGGGVLGLAIFSGLFFITGPATGMEGHHGLDQRLALGAAGFWVAALASGLLAIHGRPGDLAVRFVAWLRTLPGGHLLPEPSSGPAKPGGGLEPGSGVQPSSNL